MAGKSNPGSQRPRHLVQRTDDDTTSFFARGDFQYYLGCLREFCVVNRCAVHAYVLMPDRVHLLISAGCDESIQRLADDLRRRHDGFVHRTYGQAAPAPRDHCWSDPMERWDDILTCYRYIEQSPVRAGLVKYASRYPWSSFLRNAMGCADALVQPHASYLGLGATASARQQAYRSLFRQRVDDDQPGVAGGASASEAPAPLEERAFSSSGDMVV